MKGSRKRAVAREEERAQPKTTQPAVDRRHWLAIAGLCVLTLLVYINCFGAGFVLDNRAIILQDARVHDANPENLRQIFAHTYWWPYAESGLYRPLTTLTYLFNYAVLGNGDHAAGYHCFNLLLHAANVLLVYLLGLRLFRDYWPPVFLAAVWAAHPVLTESVTNIVGRADLLAALALLGGFWIYLKSAESEGRRRWAWLAALFAVTLAGAFSKESAVAILGVIVLYELVWWTERKRATALLLGSATVLLALEAVWYVRGAVFSGLPPAWFPYWDNPLVDAGFWTAKLTAVKVLARYIGLLLWPAHLSCDYSFHQIPLADGSVEDWLAWLVVAAAVAAMVWMYRRNRVLFFFAGLAFVTLLPTSNLVVPLGATMAERFLYLPAIALAAFVVAGCYALGRSVGRTMVAPVLLCLVIVALTGRTWARNADWQTDVTLMTAAAVDSPDSYKTHALLASALYEADPAHAQMDRVIAEAEKSLAVLQPVSDWHNNPEAYRKAAEYYQTQGELSAGHGPASEKAYRRSLGLLLRVRAIVRATTDVERARYRWEAMPNDTLVAAVERSIADLEMRLKDSPDAIEAARKAQSLDPANAAGYRQLSSALIAAGRADEAAVTLAEGTLVSGDLTLRQDLIRLYQSGLDTQGCATVAGPYGPAINPECGLVRKHVCAATSNALEVYKRMSREDLGEPAHALARQFHCQ